MRRLLLAELVDSRKGHSGGFRLGPPPGEVTFMAILEAIDHAPRPDRCAFGWGACDASAPCVLPAAWSELSGTFVR
jgi:DNA-binding IscR family transcriptional regulator